MKRLIIHFESPASINEPQPWPIGIDVDDNWTVTSGLGNDDGSRLIGFGPFGEQETTVQPAEAIAAPARVVGLSPSFAGKDGTFFVWKIPVAQLEVYEESTPTPAPASLTLTISREVKPKEIGDLLFGTGMFLHPWWLDATVYRPTPEGDTKVKDSDDMRLGDTVHVVHWETNTEGGRQVTILTLQQVCDAVYAARQHIDRESWREMTAEELGLADADAADVVFQQAVFGRIVYG